MDSIRSVDPFMFLSAECSLLRVEGFSCSFDLYGGLGISKLIEIFVQKKFYIFFQLKFFSFFGHQKPGYGCGLVPFS
jgi:hypothetical protein